jgi:hypothetical protein
MDQRAHLNRYALHRIFVLMLLMGQLQVPICVSFHLAKCTGVLFETPNGLTRGIELFTIFC